MTRGDWDGKEEGKLRMTRGELWDGKEGESRMTGDFRMTN